MSDEVKILTTNAAGDSWVDGSPLAASTGYNHQNTGIVALWNGFDKSSVVLNGLNLDVKISGLIDVTGKPFVVKSAFSLVLPTTGFNHFLKIIAGSSALEKSMDFTSDRGIYDPIKNGFYNVGGERILNWMYNVPSGKLFRISGIKDTANLVVGSNIETTAGNSQYLAATGTWYKYANWASVSDSLVEFSSNRYTAKEIGTKRILAIVNFNITTATSLQYGIAIYKNGASFLKKELQYTAAATPNDHTIEIAFEGNLNVGDYIEIFVKGQSGGGVTNPVNGRLLSIKQTKDLF